MKTLINNFVDDSPVEIGHTTNSVAGALVIVFQNMGSCHFQHSMRPEQARQMATALIAVADELAPIVAEKVAA